MHPHERFRVGPFSVITEHKYVGATVLVSLESTRSKDKRNFLVPKEETNVQEHFRVDKVIFFNLNS